MHSNDPMTFVSRCCQKFAFFLNLNFLIIGSLYLRENDYKEPM
jgi:hypothetical protein